jgi:hypothetical protein
MAGLGVEREIAGAGTLSETQIRAISLRSLEALMEMGRRFSSSTVPLPRKRYTAFYLAPDEDSIRVPVAGQAFRPIVLPQCRLLDPANLKQQTPGSPESIG